ncbi:MAG: transcriptional regulator [Spirochaetaceae bacterium]|nr:MAG: transcriptional regulator [Spirochaetaceae bacterium]
MDEKMMRALSDRLKRIEGQVRGIHKMVQEDRYCMDILAQTRSIMAAMRKVEDQIMENHLHTCVREAMVSSDEHEVNSKVGEVMTVMAGLRKNG